MMAENMNIRAKQVLSHTSFTYIIITLLIMDEIPFQLQEEDGSNDIATPTNSTTLLDLANVGKLKLELPHGYPAVEVVNYAPPRPETRGRTRGGGS